MLYQSQLMDSHPYFIETSELGSFPVHIHHENEIIYALSGWFELKVNNRIYTIKAGQLVIINSMVMHEILTASDGKFLVIELGPALLREKFDLIRNLNFEIMIYDLEKKPKMLKCVSNIMEKHKNRDSASELWVMGDLLHLYSMLYSSLIDDNVASSKAEARKSARSIESVLKYVYEHYSENIKIEEIASFFGYCKSGFCKAFKNSTGFTFHSYLNLCRIRNAEHLLVETNKSIEDIAELVGMKEAKVLCREFKKRLGITPRGYRLRQRADTEK